MPEANIDRGIARLVAARGAWGVKTHGTIAGRRGIPDWIIVHRGQALAIETKTSVGRLRPLQRHELARFDAAGGTAIVARSVDDVRQVLDDIERRARGAAA